LAQYDKIKAVDYTKLDDAAIVALIARRDERALGALYDRYSRLAFSLAVRIVGDRALAEEITADSFVNVWRASGSYSTERGRFIPWLMSVVRHRAIDELRRLSVRPEGSSIELNEALETTAHPDGVDDAFDARRRREVVRSALAKLPVPQREALELAYFGGLTQQEIAAKTGTPLGTIKTRMRLGLLKMREELQRFDDELH
jgi:RNA polymerase sigma-70 factor (ECF subfamily)